MNVWFATASRDREATSECLATWREHGYKTAALFEYGMETVTEADLIFFTGSWDSNYAVLNLMARLLAENHEADVVIAGQPTSRPDPTVDPVVVAANAFNRFSDGCFVVRAASPGPLWLGRGWIEQAYKGTGPFWIGYKNAWAETETTMIAARLDRMIDRPDIQQTHLFATSEEDSALFHERLAQSFPESSLWEP